MAVQLNIDYDQVVQLVEQLTEEQKQALITRLLTERSQQRPLTAKEKIALLDAGKIYNPVSETPSIRREDWYGDDGR